MTIFYINLKKIPIFISKIDILDTCLLWGNSYEEIFGNILRLMRFVVYFKRILNGYFHVEIIILCIVARICNNYYTTRSLYGT